MKISVYTGHVYMADFNSVEEGFSHMYNQGVRTGDIIDSEFNSVPFLMYNDILNNAGLKVNSIVSLADITSVDKNECTKNMAIVRGYLEHMEKRNIPFLMMAPRVKPATNDDEFYGMRERMIESYSMLIEYSRGSGVTICIENQSSLLRPDSEMQNIRYILDNVPELKFTLDTGNFYCIGEDFLEGYELLKDRIIHAHVKDWREEKYGKNVTFDGIFYSGCALGEGMMPLDEICRRMTNDGFDIPLTIEINSYITQRRLDASVEFLKKNLSVSY